MIAVVLVRPEHPGNVGAVARVMANFGFSNLILVDPKCEHLCDDARNRAKHSQVVLKKALVVNSLSETDCDWLVATSGKIGSDYNIPRLPLAPWQLASKLSGVKNRDVGLVFGPESQGLSNEELAKCDLFIHIKTSTDYSVLNLSHSVSIILYELSIANEGKATPFTPISFKDKEILYELFDQALTVLSFDSDKRKTQELVWHRLIGKSMLTKREAFALMGFFKKILK